MGVTLSGAGAGAGAGAAQPVKINPLTNTINNGIRNNLFTVCSSFFKISSHVVRSLIVIS
jgi:hypothetical protein